MSASQIVALVGILFLALGLRLEDVHQPLVDFFSWREASTAMMADNLPANGWNPLWPEVSWTGDQPGYQGREFQTLTIAAAILDAIFGWRDWHGR
ncbi:MAG: glycosyl transferase, partial [Hyphomicrobiaceae bacterium]